MTQPAPAPAQRRPKVPFIFTFLAICTLLYFGRDVLMPIALAILLTFILSPLVTRLERKRLHKIPAVIAVMLSTALLVTVLGYVVGEQLYGFAKELPSYSENLAAKTASIKGFGGGLTRKIENMQRLVENKPTTTPAINETGLGNAAVGGPVTQPSPSEMTPGTSAANPIYTLPVNKDGSPFSALGPYLGLVLGPLGTIGLVIVLALFMLLDQEDLRDRIIRLVSGGSYSTTTQALREATKRISRYLIAQSVVNGTYGMAISLGLLVIGYTFGRNSDVGMFPNFVLWGVLCAVLRFVPYIGPWISAIFPVAVAAAVYPGFTVMFAVLGLFVLIELISNNVMEPWLYGSSTGLSTMAVFISAIVWTWLWGPIGLILSTPLTVCLVVIGKYVKPLQFLDIALSDIPALAPGVRVYQRLLAGDAHEADRLVRRFARTEAADVPDTVYIAALRLMRRDRDRNTLDAAEETRVMKLLDESIVAWRARSTPHRTAGDFCVLGVPSHHKSEEAVLEVQEGSLDPGICFETMSTKQMASDIENKIKAQNIAALFIAVLPPGGGVQARFLCKRLREKFPALQIVVGYYGSVKNFDRLLTRFRAAGASYVTTTVSQTSSQLMAILTRIKAAETQGTSA